MKNGICTKCGLEAVFLRESSRSGVGIATSTFGQAMTEFYVCANCGYVEIYARIADLPAIAQNLPRVQRKS